MGCLRYKHFSLNELTAGIFSWIISGIKIHYVEDGYKESLTDTKKERMEANSLLKQAMGGRP